MNSKQKGKRGELELVHKLNDYGFTTHRSQQFCGKGESAADVEGLPGIHVECKRTESGHGKTYIWLEQAIRDCKEDKIPAVFHRKNNEDWLVTITLDDFMKLYKKLI